jgi:hypothetical protein
MILMPLNIATEKKMPIKRKRLRLRIERPNSSEHSKNSRIEDADTIPDSTTRENVSLTVDCHIKNASAQRSSATQKLAINGSWKALVSVATVCGTAKEIGLLPWRSFSITERTYGIGIITGQ